MPSPPHPLAGDAAAGHPAAGCLRAAITALPPPVRACWSSCGGRQAARRCDTITGMAWGEAELEPEVRDWLEGLDDQRWAQAMFHLDLLEERGALLGEPYTRQLAGKLRELRFYCGGQRVRISYWIAPGRRIIMLTVFTKTRMRETAEVARAQAALARCQDEQHTTGGAE
jgi:hypothetical protein